MTIKELSSFTGKTERTVRNWANKASEIISDKKSIGIKEKLVWSKSKNLPADYNISEVELILRSGSLSKDAVDIFMEVTRREDDLNIENSALLLPDTQSNSTLTQKDLEMISTLTAGIVSKVFENLDIRMNKIESAVSERKALLPANGISSRDHVNMIMRKYVKDTGNSFSDAYGELYQQFFYRYNKNIRQCAKNRGMATIDYVESIGMTGELEAVAMEVFI